MIKFYTDSHYHNILDDGCWSITIDLCDGVGLLVRYKKQKY